MSWLVSPTIEKILLTAQCNHILCTLQGPFRKTYNKRLASITFLKKEVNELILLKHLEQCLVPSKYF